MTNFEFFEKIGFFMTDKEGHVWEGKLSKKEQIAAFGVYFGKGMLLVDETTMTIVHLRSQSFGNETEITTCMSINGFTDKNDNTTPLQDIRN